MENSKHLHVNPSVDTNKNLFMETSELTTPLVSSIEVESQSVRSSQLYVNKEIHKICAKLDDSSVAEVCDELHVIDVNKNLDTQEVNIKIQHLTSYTNSHFEVTLSNLLKGSIATCLSKKGIYVRSHFISQLADYLHEEYDSYIKNNGMSFLHSRLGWGKGVSLKSGYFASKSIGAGYKSTLFDNKMKILGPSGDREVYDDMINKEVLPYKSMHLPLVLGFTAPIVPLMYEKSGTPVLVTNFAGKSTSGKSTSIALIASIWGRGLVSNHQLSVAKTFSQTQNSFEAGIKNNFGFPVLFDDYSNVPSGIKISKLIYDLACGESKQRLSSNGKAKPTFAWRTFIGMSGEHSIFDLTEERDGLKPRLIEFKNFKFTASKENSVNITKTVKSNYGFYGEEFVTKLQQLDQATLDALYDESETVLNNLLQEGSDNIGERILTRLVIIRMTAELVNKLMDFEVDVEYITNTLVSNELARRCNVSIEESAKEALIAYVTMHLPKFVKFDSRTGLNTTPSSQVYGKIYKKGEKNIVAMLPEVFRKALAGYVDIETILERWRNEKFIICDKSRYQKNIRITGFLEPVKCYTFVLGGDEALALLLEKSDSPDILNQLEQNDIVFGAKDAPLDLITKANKTYRRLQDGRNVIREKGQFYIEVEKSTEEPETELNPNVEFHEDFSKNEEKTVVAEESAEPPVITTSYYDEEAIEAIFDDEE